MMTEDVAKEELQNLVELVGPGFHCETDFFEYVTENDQPAFTWKECKKYNKLLQHIYKVLGADVCFEVAMKKQAELMGD
jgi:hypothetical protein